MLLITILIVLLSCLPAVWPQTSEQQPSKSIGVISGTEIPEVYRSKKHTCYVYERYEVFEIPIAGQAGQDILVIVRSNHGDARCDFTGRGEVLFIDGKGHANHFDGLYKNHLFIDQGCCPGFRGLVIYNLLTGAPVYKASVLTPVSFSYPSLTLRKKTDKTVPCPEAAEWRRKYDFRFAFDEKVVLDLNTLQEEYSGEVTCIPQQ